MADRIDIVWNRIGIMTYADGMKRFMRLFLIAKLILLLPHSNAVEESLFYMVKRNKNAFRPNLEPQETLGSILTVKLALEGKKFIRWIYLKTHYMTRYESIKLMVLKNIQTLVAFNKIICLPKSNQIPINISG